MFQFKGKHSEAALQLHQKDLSPFSQSVLKFSVIVWKIDREIPNQAPYPGK